MTSLPQYFLIGLVLGTPLIAAEPPRKFAVVELFTSEGCSSCPAADRLLGELTDSTNEEAPVYGLSFHVDYWNRLGWTDPYSTEAVTRRQSAYARHFELDAVYTPQMVVNGSKQFVGSNREAARKAIKEALAIPATNRLVLSPTQKREDQSIEIEYRVDHTAPDLMVLIAIVQKEGSNVVTRGENAGETLAHVGIVRTFRTARLENQTTGTISLTRPASISDQNLEIVGIVQEIHSAKILAADRSPFPNP